eukprot:sb/3466996/
MSKNDHNWGRELRKISEYDLNQEPTETSKQPIKDQYFLIRSIHTQGGTVQIKDQMSSFFLVYIINRSDYPAVTVTVILLCPCRIWAAYKHRYYYYYYYRIIPTKPFGYNPDSSFFTHNYCLANALTTVLARIGSFHHLDMNIKHDVDSLFRSRDWLLANQGPVFPDSVVQITHTHTTQIHICKLILIRGEEIYWERKVKPEQERGSSETRHNARYLKLLVEINIKLEACESSHTMTLSLNRNRPIRTRYLGHVTGYQPIRGQYFLNWSDPVSHNISHLSIFVFVPVVHGGWSYLVLVLSITFFISFISLGVNLC